MKEFWKSAWLWQSYYINKFLTQSVNLNVNNKQSKLQGEPKNGATDSWSWFCQFLTDLRNFFTGKFAVKRFTKNPTTPCTCYHTSLWNINVSNTSHYKLQGSVATYIRYGGVVNNQIKKVLLLSLYVKEF